ncbi:MAG: PadR family transcriptional regulator [Heliobacteriaceae bacterium]|jgi:DNA-binding PadR family transcriptional regulator|nr:PadR family transcriptional regulator [Heliobacteriaceae bacterium]
MIELLILNSLLKQELTMYGISKSIEENFAAFTKPSFGAIKPALRRLETAGYISLRKMMSDGGKLSVFYTVTKTGKDELVRLLLESLSENPHQFFSNAGIKLSCAGVLTADERKKLFTGIKSLAAIHKKNAENILNNEYNHLSFYQKIILDSTICEFKNLITIIEGLEKDNAGNSK